MRTVCHFSSKFNIWRKRKRHVSSPLSIISLHWSISLRLVLQAILSLTEHTFSIQHEYISKMTTVYNVLAQRNRYLRSVLLQNEVKIFTKACKIRMSSPVFTLLIHRFIKRFRITLTLCQNIMYQELFTGKVKQHVNENVCRDVKWAAAPQNQQNDMCAQRRLRSDWISMPSLCAH